MAFSPHVESVKVDKVLHGALDVKVELKMQKVGSAQKRWTLVPDFASRAF